jgi:hypothetical protein
MPNLFHQAPICKKVWCYIIFLFGTTHTTCSFCPSGQCSHPVQATTGGRLVAALTAEKLDEYGEPIQSYRRHIQPLKPRAIAKHKQAIVDDAEMDVEDEDFVGSSMEDESDNDTDVMEISNEEVGYISN